MADTIRVPLSPHQYRRFVQLEAELAAVERLKQENLRAIIATQVDPEQLNGWNLTVTQTEIVATPSADTGPSLVA